MDALPWHAKRCSKEGRRRTMGEKEGSEEDEEGLTFGRWYVLTKCNCQRPAIPLTVALCMKQLALAIGFATCFSCLGQHKTPSISAGSLYDVIPQVATGAGWKTTFMIANLEREKAVTWSLKFFGADGKPMPVSIVGMGRNTVFGGVLNINGSKTIETDEAGDLVQGWAKLESSGTDDVGAIVIFRQRVAGRPDFEAVVPVSYTIDYRFVLPFDNTGGFTTTLAWVNPSQFGTTEFELEIFDEAGIKLGGEMIRLTAGQREAFTLPQRFPVTAGRRGTIAPKASLESLSALGLRFSPGGSFASVHTLSR
jgi:hypothetical protein